MSRRLRTTPSTRHCWAPPADGHLQPFVALSKATARSLCSPSRRAKSPMRPPPRACSASTYLPRAGLRASNRVLSCLWFPQPPQRRWHPTSGRSTPPRYPSCTALHTLRALLPLPCQNIHLRCDLAVLLGWALVLTYRGGLSRADDGGTGVARRRCRAGCLVGGSVGYCGRHNLRGCCGRGARRRRAALRGAAFASELCGAPPIGSGGLQRAAARQRRRPSLCELRQRRICIRPMSAWDA